MVALQSAAPKWIILLDIGTTPAKYICDGGHDVTVGGQAYTADAALAGATAPAGQANISRDLYQLTFVEEDPTPTDTWKKLFKKGVGITLTVRVVFEVNGSITDTLNVYKGRSAKVEFPILDGDSDESAVIIATRLTFSGPFAKLDDEPSRVATAEDTHRIDPDDDSSDYVHRVSALTWGRS